MDARNIVGPAGVTDEVNARRTAPFLSIVMPCLNEEATVLVCVRKAMRWMNGSGIEGEVIVVDNGSTDRSSELAREGGARVVKEPRPGYGSALRRGFAEARGDWVVMGDCDDTYDFSDLTSLISPLSDGFDMVIGNRFAGGIAPGAMVWTHRYVGTPVISLLLRMFAGLGVGDSQCGLRALTRDALLRMELRTDGMELASEMVLKAARRGLKVAEVPVPYGERLGEAKLDTVRDGWRHLRFLLLSSPNYLFTVPGLLLTALGVLTLAFSLYSVNFDLFGRPWQPIFAGTIFTVVGVNALLLGLASRLYTTSRGITNTDAFTRFYRKYLSFEMSLIIGVLIIAVGGAIEVTLALVEGDLANRVAWAAIAQCLIVCGANVGLIGAVAGLVTED